MNIISKDIIEPITGQRLTVYSYDYVELSEIPTKERIENKLAECKIITTDIITGRYEITLSKVKKA